MAWYSSTAARQLSGYSTKRASTERWKAVPARGGSGYSQARASRPSSRLRIWRMGMGLTAPSRVLVRKSKKSLGKKRAEREAAIWSVGWLGGVGRWGLGWFWGGEGGRKGKGRAGWGGEDGKGRQAGLTGCGGHDDEACPVVLDEFAHAGGVGCGVEKSEDASAERARRCLLEGSLAVAMRGAASSTGGSRLGGAPGTVFLRRAGRTARARATVTVTATATDTTNPVVCVTHARERERR